MIYLILILLFLFPVYACDYKLWNFGNSYERGNTYKGYYFFLYIVVVLFLGLRNYVGGDTIGYMDMWKKIPFLEGLSKFDFLHAKYAPMWYITNSFCKTINFNFYSFQIFHAILVNGVIFYIVSKYCQYRFTVIFFYVVATLLYFNCEILRESLSLSCGLLAMNHYKEKRWLQYFSWSLFALSFHKSGIVLLVIPFVYRYSASTINYKQLLILLIVGFIFSSFLLKHIVGSFLPFFSDSFEEYSQMKRATIFGSIRSCLIVLLVACIVKQYETANSNMSATVIVGAKFYLLTQTLGLFLPIFSTRFANYFQIYYLILLGDFIWNHYGAKKILIFALYANFIFGVVKNQARDVSDWVSSTSHGYYFYQRYYPYYSIFDDISYDELNHRKNIYYQERLNRLKHE
ncbi:EpsG family protein [Segatella copri]|uniref:EpsG family protein n=1 Tax=Segatella copri TaxID=165179 RepID=A0AA92VBY3_9BACT|nr:EpsG family protein [Segatella copri]RHL39411.1 EpsG family protein [Segatella copri]